MHLTAYARRPTPPAMNAPLGYASVFAGAHRPVTLLRRMVQALSDRTSRRNRNVVPGPEWEYVGDVAVDSGQVVIVDPAYVIHGLDYDAVCAATLTRAQAGPVLFSGIGGVGVASASGYGDSLYAAYVQRAADGGRIAALKVEFITPGE